MYEKNIERTRYLWALLCGWKPRCVYTRLWLGTDSSVHCSPGSGDSPVLAQNMEHPIIMFLTVESSLILQVFCGFFWLFFQQQFKGVFYDRLYYTIRLIITM